MSESAVTIPRARAGSTTTAGAPECAAEQPIPAASKTTAVRERVTLVMAEKCAKCQAKVKLADHEYREHGRHCVDADRHRAGAHDDTGVGILLRWNGAGKEYAQHHDDELRRDRIRRHRLGARRVLARILQRIRA